MFTGIVETVGRINKINELCSLPDKGIGLEINSGGLDLTDVAIGDSIAINGVCLTVININATKFSVEVSRETLNCTYGLDQAGMRVNLEKAMRLSDRLGGHLVSGHIDSIGTVTEFKPVGESYLTTILAPVASLKYIAPKGAITLNGVSLTTNQVDGDKFSINLIPHTLTATTLNELFVGAKVNLETDMLARYVARLISFSK